MQYQTIQSPIITSTQNCFPFQSQKSKQLPSYTGIANKCLKIIALLNHEKIISLSKYTQSKDPIQVLNILIDSIYELVEKTNGNNTQISQIQNLLQKQQNLNRTLIKKQLENQEHHKIIIDQLSEQKNKTIMLIQHISKLNQQIKDKQLAILHAKNQLKACQKQRKILDNNKGELTLQKKFNSYLSKQIEKDQNKMTFVNMVHQRRKSQEIGRKVDKNEGKKKMKDKDKQKQKQKDTKKKIIAIQNKISGR